MQKAKVKWLREGDNNTSCFHAVLKKKQQNQVTKMLKYDGTSFDSPEAINEGAVHYFQDFLSHRCEGVLFDLSSITDKVITTKKRIKISPRVLH